MLATKVVDEIRRLLAEDKFSQREIARLTGTSRGSVGAIASGKRRESKPPAYPWDEVLEEPEGPAERCPACGGMVYMPCRLCMVRKAIDKKTLPASDAREIYHDDPLKLNLRGELHARFEQVMEWRREQSLAAL
jgi:transcriptional regulator with XRE-family HTH domain